MSTLLLPDLARENAASNRRVARSVEQLRPKLEAVKSAPRDLANGAREALRYTLVRAAEVRDFWQAALALLEEGLEGGESRDVVQAVLEAFDSWLTLVESTRGLCAGVVQGDHGQLPLTELDAASDEMQRLREAVVELHGFLGRPWPAIDSQVLARARQAVAQGRYLTAEAVRNRLRNRPG